MFVSSLVQNKEKGEMERRRKEFVADSLRKQYQEAIEEKKSREADRLEKEMRLAKAEIDLHEVRERFIEAEA